MLHKSSSLHRPRHPPAGTPHSSLLGGARHLRQLALVLFVLASANVVPTAAYAGKADDTVRFSFGNATESIDSYFNTARTGNIIAIHIWDTLIYWDPRTRTHKPLLAASWRWVDDTTIDFVLRQDVKFHNGDPLVPEDVVYTFNFIIDPTNKVPGLSQFTWIAGAEKIDQNTVRVRLKHAFPPALDYFAGPLFVYPHRYYKEVGPKGMSQKPVGTGPYRAVEVVLGKSVKFKRNQDYISDGPKAFPRIENLEMRIIPEDSTRLAQLLTGGLDWEWRVPIEQVEELRKRGITVIPKETNRIGYLQFDAAGRSGSGNPLASKTVRQAIAHAIDWKEIKAGLLDPGVRKIHTACYPGHFGCTDEGAPRYEYDPAKAKRLLAEAGFPNGFDIELHAFRDRALNEAYVNYLVDVGIKAQLRFLGFVPLRQRVQAGQIAASSMSWATGGINDISASTSYFFKFGPDDYARDPIVRDWLAIADSSTVPEVRRQNYAKALVRIAEEVYWLPTFTDVTYFAINKDLDMTADEDEVPRFYDARWK